MSALATCSQCGAELQPTPGQVFVTCGNCGAAVYIDRSQVVFHFAVEPTVSADQARGLLARWMAGNDTVKDLDQKAVLQSTTFEYFPLWYFKQSEAKGYRVVLEPAAATSISELRRLQLPAGDLKTYPSHLDGQAVAPTVPLEAALEWAKEQGVPHERIAEAALVHIPLYTFKYGFNGQTYTTLIEAATGKPLANLFPAKAEAPYQIAGVITAAVFLLLAFVPVIGVAMGEEALLMGLLVCFGLGALALLPLFALAAWVAAKV
ncbi:MAG TPA: hypothetical protein PLC98_20240 [Anaerolineales bacterium]|nr:hypothetical protein [Anaerolineales bacterium]